MGNQQANENNLSLTSQEREDWIKLEDQGYCQLWANKKTNKRFQAYPISDAATKDNVQIEKYAFRKMHNAFLVSAEAVIAQNQTFLCSVPATSFVLIQNIVNRLKSFPSSFSFQEALYILSSSASGYNTLCSFFGPLQPNEDMICFNDTGNVKVWLNENLSKNEASPNARSVELEMPKMDDCNFAERRSRQCVQKLLKIVEASTVQGFPRAFKEQTRKLSTFFEISNYVDYFCVQNNIKILDHIEFAKMTLTQGNHQIKMGSNVGSAPMRVQGATILQSSRVNQVFHSNHHQRQGPSPVFIPQNNQTFVGVPQFPPQVFSPLPPGQWRQNHQVSYIVSQPILPPVQLVNSLPPQVIVSSNPVMAIPPPIQTFHNNQTIIKRVEVTEEPAKSNRIEKVKSELIERVVAEAPQQKLPQIISTPEQPQEIALPVQGSLNKHQVEQCYDQQPQFHESNEPHHYESAQDIPKNSVYNAGLEYQQPHEEQVEYRQEEVYEDEGVQYYSYKQETVNQVHQPQYQFRSVEEIQNQESEKNIYQQEYYEGEYQPQRQPNSESVYSNIEKYVAPLPQAQIESIEEKREEEIISPQKESQIDEWSQKLDSFTQSKEKNHKPPRIQIQKPQQNDLNLENKQPESFKNLVVSDKRQEYVNELVDLEQDDIEKYIRMKYQSYLKEESQPQPESIETQYRKQSENYYPNKYESYRSNNYPTEDNAESSNDYYQPTSYDYKSSWQKSQNVEKQNEPQYQYQTSYNNSNNNRISIEQDFQQDYASSRRNEPSSYGYRFDNNEPEDNYNAQYQRAYAPRNRESERRNSSRNSNVIDQKYSKYVLNSQKPKRALYNINSEDVSLILPVEQSTFLKQTPKPIVEQSFDHDSFSYNKPSASKGITYEKLRNLLWEE